MLCYMCSCSVTCGCWPKYLKRLVVPAFCAPMMVNRGKHFKVPRSLKSTGDGHRGPRCANSKYGLCTCKDDEHV